MLPLLSLSLHISPPPSTTLFLVPRESGGLEMAGCNEENKAPQREEASMEKKYGGIAPKKPLISKDHERAYFDSADWVLGKQGANNNTRNAIEYLKPKLKRTPHHQLPPRKPTFTSSGENRA
ncbi:uncharacterized protein LOC109708398 [Ananas comosus]|uniref:Uncharacterized protein LOC109708398 n=1 Tax=Ananas comosus TaxID=4615 RepID=A0A199VKU6_ANACO|nr:uncharacterized protein LOC109708398 [Ananas comosus]OAY77365.1 hypothetical protein ACMD2_01728 [Ananas comosus]